MKSLLDVGIIPEACNISVLISTPTCSPQPYGVGTIISPLSNVEEGVGRSQLISGHVGIKSSAAQLQHKSTEP